MGESRKRSPVRLYPSTKGADSPRKMRRRTGRCRVDVWVEIARTAHNHEKRTILMYPRINSQVTPLLGSDKGYHKINLWSPFSLHGAKGFSNGLQIRYDELPDLSLSPVSRPVPYTYTQHNAPTALLSLATQHDCLLCSEAQ